MLANRAYHCAYVRELILPMKQDEIKSNRVESAGQSARVSIVSIGRNAGASMEKMKAEGSDRFAKREKNIRSLVY